MGAVAVTPWRLVRCPCGRNTLGEVRGEGGEVRRYCNRCKVWRIVDVESGAVRTDTASEGGRGQEC